MLTIGIECRKIGEWNTDTQKKIIEQHRDINVEHHKWWDGTYDYWKEKLEGMGYNDVDISFRGFWSQGDGASYTGTIDIKKWIETQEPIQYSRILKLINSGALVVRDASITRHSAHYVHERTTDVYIDWYLGDYSAMQSLLDKLEEDIKEHHLQLNKEIYKDLEEEYEGQTSDEAVMSTLEANEYELSADGIIHG